MELKHAKRVLIEGNVFENSWADGQVGWGLIFQSVTDHPELAPWTQTADVTMRYNVVKNVWGGIDLTANGWNGSGVPMTRISVENNLFQNIGGETMAIGVQLLNGLTDVSVRHNTIVRNTQAYGMPVSLDGGGAGRIALMDNVFATGTPYGGIFKSGGLLGAAALSAFAGSTGWQNAGNVYVQDAGASSEAPGNLFAPDLTSVGFASDWSLSGSSPYKGKASDGNDPGRT